MSDNLWCEPLSCQSGLLVGSCHIPNSAFLASFPSWNWCITWLQAPALQWCLNYKAGSYNLSTKLTVACWYTAWLFWLLCTESTTVTAFEMYSHRDCLFCWLSEWGMFSSHCHSTGIREVSTSVRKLQTLFPAWDTMESIQVKVFLWDYGEWLYMNLIVLSRTGARRDVHCSAI